MTANRKKAAGLNQTGGLAHWENLRKTKKQADSGLNPT